MSGTVTLDAFDKQPIPATVSTIGYAPKSGETGTVYEIKMDLPQTTNRLMLRLGMTGDVEFILRQLPDVLSVPKSYVKSESGKKYLLVKDGNSRKKVYVQVGEELDGNVEIKTGLKENDIVY